MIDHLPKADPAKNRLQDPRATQPVSDGSGKTLRYPEKTIAIDTSAVLERLSSWRERLEHVSSDRDPEPAGKTIRVDMESILSQLEKTRKPAAIQASRKRPPMKILVLGSALLTVLTLVFLV